MGAIGDSTTAHRGYAVKVMTPAGVVNPDGTQFLQNIVRIAAGGTGTNGFSLAVAADGTVYSWGRNGNGQLGNNSTTNATRPVVVPNFKLLPGYPATGLTATLSPPGALGTVLLTASPSDPDGAGTISNIKLYVNGGIVSDGPSPTHSYVPTTAGTYHAFAIVTDNTGIQAQSPPVNFSVSAPQVSLAVQVAPVLAPGHVILKATPTDADGPGNLSVVKFYVNGGPVPVGQATAPNWEFAYLPPQPGAFSATAKVIDHFGFEGTSGSVPFSVYAPQIPLAVTAIVHEDPGYVTLTASPTDADGPANLSHVIFYSSGTMVNISSSPPWTVEMPSLANGNYSVSARAYDRFGFVADSPPLAFTIHNQGGGPDDDGDGITNADETTAGTSPTDSDSDNDGIPDGIDTSPLSPDFVTQTATGLSVWAPLP